MCPATLVCDYAAGKCNVPGENWWAYGTSIWDAPAGEQVFKLSQISAYQSGGMEDMYTLQCNYDFPENTSGKKNPDTENVVTMMTYVSKLGGDNWGYHGFGKTLPICNGLTPERCTGEGSPWSK